MATPDIASIYQGILPSLKGAFVWVIPAIVILFGMGLILYKVRENKLYRYHVTIFGQREGGGVKERETKGAFITRRGGTTYFSIKVGAFKKKEFITPPLLEGITGGDRLYYYQKDIDTYIQLRRAIDDSIVKFIPVESDIKYGAILAIQRIKDVLRKENKWEKLIAPLTIIIGLVIIMVMFYFMLEKFDPQLALNVAQETAKAADSLAKVHVCAGA